VNTLEYKPDYRRYLPHIQPPGATLFITFRLASSLPKSTLTALRNEASLALESVASINEDEKRRERAYLEQRRHFGRWDEALDQYKGGVQWLAEERIAKLVAERIYHHDGQLYELDAFCIMSNHVHLLFTPLQKTDGSYHSLAAIMQSLKGYTVRRANQLLGRQGRFWQPESYDHIVRDREECDRIIRYILNNPVKAGLVGEWSNWPWTYWRYSEGD
jgi:REP element-mobilizing transposase RayT